MQILDHSFVCLLIREENRVQVDPACQVGERGSVFLLHAAHKLADIVPRRDIELPGELPVDRVLDNDIFDQASVVDHDLELFVHIFSAVPAGNAAEDPLGLYVQDISPGRGNDIAPGIIVTPLAIDEFNGPRGDFYKNMFAKCPAGRPGTADEMANIAELLMSDAGAFITGSTFLADGGATASYYYGPLQPEE